MNMVTKRLGAYWWHAFVVNALTELMIEFKPIIQLQYSAYHIFALIQLQ